MDDNYWKDKQGNKHYIPGMETEYLINIVKNIESIRKNWQENEVLKKRINIYTNYINKCNISLEEKKKIEKEIKELKNRVKLFRKEMISLLAKSNTSFSRKYKNVSEELAKRIGEDVKN